MRGRPAGSTVIDYNRVKKLYNPNATDKENASTIGIKKNTFTRWRIKNGYEPFERKRVKINKDEFYRLYNLGWSDILIAKEFGTSPQNIYYYRKRHGIPTNHPWIGRSAGKLVDSMLVLTDEDKPWKDPESLYCDKKFLEKFKEGNFEEVV